MLRFVSVMLSVLCRLMLLFLPKWAELLQWYITLEHFWYLITDLHQHSGFCRCPDAKWVPGYQQPPCWLCHDKTDCLMVVTWYLCHVIGFISRDTDITSQPLNNQCSREIARSVTRWFPHYQRVHLLTQNKPYIPKFKVTLHHGDLRWPADSRHIGQ